MNDKFFTLIFGRTNVTTKHSINSEINLKAPYDGKFHPESSTDYAIYLLYDLSGFFLCKIVIKK